MDKIYNKNKSKGGKKTPLIGITTISGMPDYENALLMSDSTAGCLRITNKLPRLIGARTLCKRCLWHVLHRGRLSQIRSICVPYKDYFTTKKCIPPLHPGGEGRGEGWQNNYNPATNTDRGEVTESSPHWGEAVRTGQQPYRV